jgi:ABC-type multidrug transport system ATPase subunit
VFNLKILVDNVWYSYDGVTYALRNINIYLTEPGIYLITGPNGAGKTTLLKVISLLLKPTIGRIQIEGVDYWNSSSVEKTRLKSTIIFVHDKPLLVRGSVEYNVSLGLKLKGLSSNDIIDYYIKRYNLSDVRNKSIYKLSAGQLKTASIIRALVLRPKLLALDEPFTFLDNTRVKLLIEDLLNLADKGSIVIVASHYIYRDLVEKCKGVIELFMGELLSLKIK